jgi:hypothetical protein
MDWYLWLIVGLWLLSLVLNIADVGKPRQPRTPMDAAILTVVIAGLIAGLLVTR